MTAESPRAIADALLARERFVLSSHARPDGDSIGSQLALAHALRARGKQVRIVNHDRPPPFLSTLPGVETIEVSDAVAGRFDASVVLECSTLERTEVRGLDAGYVINIDHHAGNTMYGALNWFDESAAACTEMVHEVVTALDVALTPAIGTALYVGILTDTGSFRHANITPRTFDICRRVAAAGVDVAAVAAAVYQSSTLGKLKLTRRLLETMRLAAGGRVAILSVDDAMFTETGCPPDDMEGLINMPLAAHDIDAVVMFKVVHGVTRVSLRSKGEIDVRAVAASFGGGGHRNASGFSSDAPAPDVEALLVTRVAAAVARAAVGPATDPAP